MPYRIELSDLCPKGKPYAVVGPNGVKGCHRTHADAEAQMAALYANEPGLAEAAHTMQGQFLGAFQVPPLADMTDAEIEDMSAALADTIADSAEGWGVEVTKRAPVIEGERDLPEGTG